MAELEHYKMIQQRVERLEAENNDIREGLNHLMDLHEQNRIDIDKVAYVLFGDKEIGLIGILDRVRKTETDLVRRQNVVLYTTVFSFGVILSLLIYLVVVTL